MVPYKSLEGWAIFNPRVNRMFPLKPDVRNQFPFNLLSKSFKIFSLYHFLLNSYQISFFIIFWLFLPDFGHFWSILGWFQVIVVGLGRKKVNFKVKSV